ncbi:MAG: hypothetical protein IPN16_00870 [Gemmatimonadetes bacterium]|nr:hypothetical protein [Gemmatimonadota bacterium]MBK8645115.1 hypothetical protein [Gemmatimonadota bacterium]MBP9106557.1 hypothetical protein [Gemmatimonadaceae bacterium]
MRIALFALMATSVLAVSPRVSAAQRVPSEGEVRSRERDVDVERGRNDRWDWDRNRDKNRDRDRYDDRRDNRGIGWGYGRDDDWKAYEREQRDFERRSRRWNRYQWDAFRDCERDLWRRSRWDRVDTRREAIRERRRIRDYCERRVSRW